MTWRLDLRPGVVNLDFDRTYLIPERRGNERAHLVTARADGSMIRVLPDGEKTGQKRSYDVRSALERYDALTSDSVDLTAPWQRIAKELEAGGLTFEHVGREEGTVEAVAGVIQALAATFDETGRIHPPIILEHPRAGSRRLWVGINHLAKVSWLRVNFCTRLVAVGRSLYFWVPLGRLYRFEVA